MMDLRSQLIIDEDEVLHLYYDPRGIPTIGIGCNLNVRVPADLCQHITITEEGSRLLFERRLTDVRADLAHHLPWALALDAPRQDVLLNMIYNMGVVRLLRKNPKFLAALRRGEWTEAKRQMLGDDWERQVGARARRLAAQIETGDQ